MTLSRRTLLGSSTAALCSLAPGVRVAFATDAPKTNNTIVFLFLRFGMDGLQMVAPSEDNNYRDLRRIIGVPSSGPSAGLPVGSLDGVPFFMHPRAPELKAMFDAKKLALVHAAGVPTGSRSHFKNQDMVDKGMADRDVDPRSGWLSRHLTALSETHGDFAAASTGGTLAPSLVGFAGALAFSDVDSFANGVYGPMAKALKAIHRGDSTLEQSVQQSLTAIETVLERTQASPRPSTSDAGYTYGALSRKLQPLARLLKLDLGVEVATVDFDNWDHHDFLTETFGRQAEELSKAVTAFYKDLGTMGDRVTVVAVTEFGRRVKENANAGTDHGAGSVMMVMGGGVNGGKIYGQWPGLSARDLDDGDLAVTTDYRHVLGEVLVRRHGQTKIENVFPSVSYKPLGIMS